MKNQALFSLKDKSKKSKCRLLQFLFGPLSLNVDFHPVDCVLKLVSPNKYYLGA